MKNLKYFGIALLVVITGCASSSDIEKRASMHSKAGSYYKSIGQPSAAREEYNQANKSWDNANDLFPILVDLFKHFTKD